MATTAPNYLCNNCGQIQSGVILEVDPDGKVIRWSVPRGWRLTAKPKLPTSGAKALCSDCT